MKFLINTKFLLCLLSLTVFSCQPVTTDLQTKPKVRPQAQTLSQTISVSPTQARLNILFVVDNSGSMKPYQETLSKNLEQFSRVFFKNKRIDYKIGVVPVYDSKYLNDTTVYKSGLRQMNPLGELVKLKGREDLAQDLYITPTTPEPEKVLRETVMIGTQWGPEAEESFSPVLAVIDPETNRTKNNHFYDEDAHLVIIFLTDADDVTPGLSAEDFYQRLLKAKKGDASKIFIAAALPDLENNSSACQKDGRGPVQAFPSLLAVSGGLIANLCGQQFGSQMARFAQNVSSSILRQKIKLPFTPDIDTLKITFGSEQIQPNNRVLLNRGPGGYFYDVKLNEIIIDTEFSNENPNGQFFIEATPLDPSLIGTGRLKQI